MELTTSFQKLNEVYIGNTGYGNVYLRIYARVSSDGYDITNNRTKVYAKSTLYLSVGSFHSDTGTTKSLSCTGLTSVSGSANGNYNAGETTLCETNGYVTHNNDGTKSITVSANWASTPWGWSKSVSGTATLPKIPRYPTANQSISSKTETEINVSWSSNTTIDGVWYSIDNGANWNWVHDPRATSGSFKISGLSANTTYNVKTRLKSLSSQLSTDTNTATITTYAYPYCTNAPSFVIGNNVKIDFYNPLNRTMQIQMWSHVSGQFVSDLISVTGTSYTGFSNVANRLYQSIPNSKESGFNIDVHCFGNKSVMSGGKYSINANVAKPIFSNFGYSTDLSELTGNNETIINGKTTTDIIISTANKASGYQGATISKYRIECGNIKNEVNYSDSEIVQKFYNCISPTLKVTAIDSRGLETTVSKNVTNFKNYAPPSFGVSSTERKNGVDTESYLDAKINFWNGNFGAVQNEIIGLAYRSKKRGTNEYSGWSYIDVSKLVINNNEASLENYMIHANGTDSGFEIGIAYDIELAVSDGYGSYALSTINNYIITLTDGKVGFSLLKDAEGNYHAGIDGMPDLKAPLNIRNKNPLVKVSAEQPDTGEEVWMRKGKNLFNIGHITPQLAIYGNNECSTTELTNTSDYMPVNAHQEYTFSYEYSSLASEGARSYIFYDSYKAFLYTSAYNSSDKEISITPTQDGYVRISYDKNCYNLQFEAGSKTPYEPYINKKMFTKDEDGTYREFFNVEQVNNSLRGNYYRKKTTFDGGLRWHNSDYPKYYLLTKLPPHSNNNGATLRINGFMGAYFASGKAIVDVLIANRNGLRVYGTYIGDPQAFSNSRLEIFEQTNGEHWVYFVQNDNYTAGFVLDVIATDVLEVSSELNRVSPSGTQVKIINGDVLTKIA